MVVKILQLIPVKMLAKKLPQILAFILTRALTWVSLKYPQKTEKVIETTKEITVALIDAVNASEDGVITKEEISKQRQLWKEVFR